VHIGAFALLLSIMEQKRPARTTDSLRSATHNLRVGHRFFGELCQALHTLSVQQSDLYSFRRLVARVLQDPAKPVCRLDAAVLDAICRPDQVHGRIRLALRIDSSTNDLLREFRELAAARLGRQVSVGEALAACLHAVLHPG
jgi:hypothetical protein